MVEVVIALSAYRHGVADEDMLHAFRNPIRTFELEEAFTMFVGPDRSGRPVEIGFVVSDDDVVVIVHAMKPARPKFLR